VRAAARLKHRPPAGWIRHYLPDDRYKILGGTWKFVSTELDRFYYPAWAPEMLRQRASRVIGFASAEDAQEAGYLPGGGYANVDPSFDKTIATRVVVQRATARRVVLADRRSTALIPNGWQHSGQVMNVQSFTIPLDTITSPDGQTMISISQSVIPNLPQGANLQNALRSGNINQLMKNARQSGPINSQVDSVLGGAKTSPAIVGGLRGVTMTPNLSLPGQFRNTRLEMMMAGRGNTLYTVSVSSNGTLSPAARNVVRSIRFR
jgi:hypothetical protein